MPTMMLSDMLFPEGVYATIDFRPQKRLTWLTGEPFS